MAKHRRNNRRRAGTAVAAANGSAPRREQSRPDPTSEGDGNGGTTPAVTCAGCFPASRPGEPVRLRHGVTLALCEQHRNPEFIASASGRALIDRIVELLASLGFTSRRYADALADFVRSCATPPTSGRPRPGSYAYPDRRLAAQRVWAEGGSFADGLAVALEDGPPAKYRVRLPSIRTVQRWRQEARLLRLGSELPPAT